MYYYVYIIRYHNSPMFLVYINFYATKCEDEQYNHDNDKWNSNGSPDNYADRSCI